MASLLNTKWQFKESLIGIPADIEMNLTFISDGVSYKKIKWVASPGLVYTREDDVEKTVYAVSGTTGLWETENYRTIEITGGADVEDETVQSALSALAVQIEDEPSTPSITTLKGATIKFKSEITNFITNGSSLVSQGSCEINGKYFSTCGFDNQNYDSIFTIMNLSEEPFNLETYSYIPNDFPNSATYGWSYTVADDNDINAESVSPITITNFDFPDLNENVEFISWVSQNAEVSFPEEETKYYISGAWKLKGEKGSTIPIEGINLTQEVNFKYYDFYFGVIVDDVYKIEIRENKSSLYPLILVWAYRFDNYRTICEGGGWGDIDINNPIIDFGSTPQEVSKEFYDIIHEHADQVNWNDYYKTVSGKYKWNDSLPVADYFVWRPKKVGDYELNHIDYYVTSGVLDGIYAFVLLKQNNEGTSYERVGIYINYPGVLDTWLDGSVTVEQFYQGVTPVPSDIYQTWEFENTVLPVLEYNYLMENATEVTDTPSANTIKAGTYRFKDVLDSPSTDGTSANMKYTVLCGDELHNGYFISAGGDSMIYSTDKSDLFVYNFSSATWATNYGDKIKIITVTEDTEVSENFSKWFNANAVPQKLMPAGVYRMKLSMIEIDISQYPETDVTIDEDNGNSYELKLKTQKTFETYKNCKTAVNNMLRFHTYGPFTSPGLDAEYNDVYNQGLADTNTPNNAGWWGYHSDIINFTEEQYVDYILYDLIQEHAEPTTIRTLNGKYKFKDKLPLFNSSDVETIMLDNVTINNVNYGAAGFLNESLTSNFGFTGVSAYTQQSANDENPTILYIDDYGWLDGKLTLGGLGTTPITPSDVTQTWEFNNTKVFYDFDYDYIMNNLYVDPDDPDVPDIPKPKFKIINPLVIFTSGTKAVGTDLIVDAEEVEVVGEEETPTAPTNLTDYEVTVPANWSATAGYGKFSVNYFYNGLTEYRNTHLNVGYDGATPYADCLDGTYWLNDMCTQIKLHFLSGTDTTNQKLIQWLVDNNATFTYVGNGGIN